MRTLWLLFKTELKLSIRDFSSVLFALIIPVGIMILFGALFGNETYEEGGIIYSKFEASFAAVSTMGICSAGIMGLPLALSEYREKKILKRYKVTPVSPINLLLAHLLICFFISILSVILIFFVSKVFFSFTMKGSVIQFILAYLLVMVSIHCIGLIVASLSPDSKIAAFICTFLYFPMILLSGATIPYEIMPTAMQSFANIMPVTQGIKVLKGIAIDQHIQNMNFSLIVMIAIIIIGIPISIKTFKWD